MVAALLMVAGVALSLLPGGGEPGEVTAPVRVHDERPSIAVLPLDNLSPDADDAYFADGMQEEITSKLSTLSALRVISRSSVMQYREERPPSPEISEDLGIEFPVEGSARLSRDQVRLIARLMFVQMQV